VKIGEERITMNQVVSTQGIRRVLNLGVSRPIHLGAVGIVLMGDMPDEDILQMLKRRKPRALTSKTVTDPRDILALVHKARVDGFCMLGEQTEEGVGVIALPIHDHLNAIPAAVVVSGPIQRWNPKAMQPYVKRMKAIVDGVSLQLGRVPNGAASAAPAVRVAAR
jgi:IclR family pca regulon transcriptional regulator